MFISNRIHDNYKKVLWHAVTGVWTVFHHPGCILKHTLNIWVTLCVMEKKWNRKIYIFLKMVTWNYWTLNLTNVLFTDCLKHRKIHSTYHLNPEAITSVVFHVVGFHKQTWMNISVLSTRERMSPPCLKRSFTAVSKYADRFIHVHLALCQAHIPEQASVNHSNICQTFK